MVKLPEAPHYTQPPDVQLFNEIIFPRAAKPARADLAVEVTAKNGATLSAAWTLMAKLASPVGDAAVSFQLGLTDRNLVRTFHLKAKRSF